MFRIAFNVNSLWAGTEGSTVIRFVIGCASE
jgi:hypothetical protein